MLVLGIWIQGQPAEAKETQEYTVGQWTGYSYASDDTGQFTDCTVWAFNRDNVQVGISVRKDWSLEMWLNSKTWTLPDKQSYPVTYWIDRNQTYSGKAQVSGSKFVSIDVDDDNDVFQQIRAGSRLTFRTTNVDYIFDLNSSRAALDRLLDCVDQYAKASTSNPFGGDAGSGGGTGTSFDGGATQEQGGNQQSNANQGGGDGNSSMLKTMSLSADDVRGVLVDVTGAKPSMISIEAKTDKSGNSYYAFSTPLGLGQFWQERPVGTPKEIADDYIDIYKGDCKGTFEPSLGELEKGPKGATAASSAVCSSSPYQDNGPEVLTYVVSEQEGVVSIYMSYVGGNSAKSKTDALGKLLSRRMTRAIQDE